jgi:hypothetical protein
MGGVGRSGWIGDSKSAGDGDWADGWGAADLSGAGQDVIVGPVGALWGSARLIERAADSMVAEVAEDAVDDGRLGDDGEDLEGVPAARAEEGVGLVDATDEVRP